MWKRAGRRRTAAAAEQVPVPPIYNQYSTVTAYSRLMNTFSPSQVGSDFDAVVLVVAEGRLADWEETSHQQQDKL
jgi:hypothetical protein